MSLGLRESDTLSVAQRVLSREAEVRYHGRTTSRGFQGNREVSSAFVTTPSFFYSFYGFLRNINLGPVSQFFRISTVWDVKEPLRYS